MFLSCTSQSKKDVATFEDCDIPAPSAIFNPEFDSISKHDFSLKKDHSVERLEFTDGLQLELIQSGCKNFRQEFVFTLPGEISNLEMEQWALLGGQLFRKLASVSPAVAPLNMEAQVIEQNQLNFKKGESIDVDGGQITLDYVKGKDESLLIVIFNM